MARPSKYNEETVGRFLELVSNGCTIKDAAYSVGVSDMTINRWRAKHSDFNLAMMAATREGWDYAASMKAEGYRTYRRSKEYYKHPVEPEKAHTEALAAPQAKVLPYHKGRTIAGLPVRPRISDSSLEPFINPDTWQVEWRTMDGVLHTCPIAIWEQRHQPKMDEPFIWEWY